MWLNGSATFTIGLLVLPKIWYLLGVLVLLTGIATPQSTVLVGSESQVYPSPPSNFRNAAHLSVKPAKKMVLFMPGPRFSPAGKVESQDLATQRKSLSSAVASPTIYKSFLGLQDFNIAIPPDTMGAVGPNHIFVLDNEFAAIESRSGSTSLGYISPSQYTDQFFGAIQSSDPDNFYDPYNDRWVATIADGFNSSRSAIHIAVSATGDPAGQWFHFQVPADQTGQTWADYPRVGFNGKWIVVTANMYSISKNEFVRGAVWVFNKGQLYAGGAATYTFFSHTDFFSLIPAFTYDNSTTALYLLQSYNGDSNGNGLLRLSKIDGSSPSLTVGIGPAAGLTAVSSPWASSSPKGADFAPQLGSSNKIATDDDRIMNVVYRNGAVWAAHTIFLPSSTPTRAAIQWWQLGTDGSIQQFGRIDDAAGTEFRAYPSIAVNSQNDAVIGYSIFSSAIYPSSAYSFRAGSDPLSTLQSETLLHAGAGPYYQTFGGPSNRWGDFSTSCVDPLTDLGLWTIQEDATANNQFETWWGQVAVGPPPVTQLQLNIPLQTIAGTPFNVTVSAVDSAGNIEPYLGSVHFSSGLSASDSRFVLPPDSALVNGSGTFSLDYYIGNPPTSWPVIVNDTVDRTLVSQGSLEVLPAQPQLLLSSSQPVYVGDPVTLTLQAGGSAGVPLGNAELFPGQTAPFFLNSATTYFPLGVLPLGSHNFYVEFFGNQTYAFADSNTYTVNVLLFPTSLSVSSSAVTTVQNQTVTYSAIVAPATRLGQVPTGTVTFDFSGVVTGNQTVTIANGVATLLSAVASSAPGAFKLYATYSGDSMFAPSQSPAIILLVTSSGQTSTSTVLNSLHPVFFRDSIDLSATVQPIPQSSSQNTVYLIVDGYLETQASLGSSGTAQLSLSHLSPGNHAVQAVYSGDGLNAAGSISSPLTIYISPGPHPR